MAIMGPFPDGGYELWCPCCNSKISCFSPAEIMDVTKRLQYELFICKDCLPILSDGEKKELQNKIIESLYKEHDL